MDLHRQLQQLVENAICFLSLVQACLHRPTQRLDLIGEMPLYDLLVLTRGVVRMTDKQFYDIVDTRTDGGAALVDLVEIDEGAIQSQCAGVDELCDCGAKTIRIADVLESICGPHEFEVGRSGDKGELPCPQERISESSLNCVRDVVWCPPRIETAIGAGSNTSAEGNAYDVLTYSRLSRSVQGNVRCTHRFLLQNEILYLRSSRMRLSQTIVEILYGGHCARSEECRLAGLGGSELRVLADGLDPCISARWLC